MEAGFVIAGTHSGCGKTTVTMGILAALTKMGLRVQPFKVGPDFIDPGLHRMVTGRPSRNLDRWMCGDEYVKDCFLRHAQDADISVVEGVMGMYDGESSAARIAGLLGLPVILVVDAYGMAESAGAVVHGFANYPCEPRTEIIGIIFNRVASESHFARLKKSVTDVPVLGWLPRERDFQIPERHLGLVTAEEAPLSCEGIDRLADMILEHVDMETIIKKGSRVQGPGSRTTEKGTRKKTKESDSLPLLAPGPRPLAPLPLSPDPGPWPLDPVPLSLDPVVKVGVAYDKAFCFYYEDNLDLLRKAGAEICFFSPLADRELPDVDLIYIGGGYPEVNARELSENRPILNALLSWAEAGKPLYAECGGLMYLSKGVHTQEGDFFPMAGILPFETEMTKRPVLGYREVSISEDCILGKKGSVMRGHEFHYSVIRGEQTGDNCYSATTSTGQSVGTQGYRWKNTLASYIHIHLGSNRETAGCLVRSAEDKDS
ncbi:MAG: cobyrinate a,c-diamide synthase [Nitrospirales bacterium]|nr:cobyrinate a,c-diamide synthase [Nitrospirales bacterium]